MATAGAIRRRTLTLVTIPFAHGPSLGTPLLLSPGFGKGNRCRDPPPDSGGDSLLTERIQGSLSDLAFIIPIFKPNLLCDDRHKSSQPRILGRARVESTLRALHFLEFQSFKIIKHREDQNSRSAPLPAGESIRNNLHLCKNNATHQWHRGPYKAMLELSVSRGASI